MSSRKVSVCRRLQVASTYNGRPSNMVPRLCIPPKSSIGVKKENKVKISTALTKRDKDCQLNGITVCRNGFCHSTLTIKIDKGCKARTSEEPSQLYMLSEPPWRSRSWELVVFVRWQWRPTGADCSNCFGVLAYDLVAKGGKYVKRSPIAIKIHSRSVHVREVWKSKKSKPKRSCYVHHLESLARIHSKLSLRA